MYNGRLLYLSKNGSESTPRIKIAWLKKFVGDDYFQPTVLSQSQLQFNWDNVTIEEHELAGLFHQQHYTNFYHMFSEVAPSAHFIMCKYLKDCTYSPYSRTRLFFIQEKPPEIPQYLLLDSISDTFKCLSPAPVQHKDDPELQNKVVILRRAVVGISNEVRAFHNWEEDFKKQYHEPSKSDLLTWRQRLADCFGFNFTQEIAPTDNLKVLFINRHYDEGRMILNQAKLAHMIERMPEADKFESVEIKQHYLNSDDKLSDQAKLFWSSSLLIWPHGATMALTIFLPRGAQAIEVIPWVEEDKARLPEWVETIQDTFSLDITLYAVQNRDRRRVMFNQDAMLDYPQYRDAPADQKVALLERGECPSGVDGFTCPFWWNHWKVSLHLEWTLLEPAMKSAVQQLLQLRKAGRVLPPGQASFTRKQGKKRPQTLEQGAGSGPLGDDTHNRSLTETPPSQHLGLQQQQGKQPANSLTPAAVQVLADTGNSAANGVPLSSYACLHDDGKAEHRLCIFNNLLVRAGKLYYVTESPVQLPEIQLAWEEWDLEEGLREDKYFAPVVVKPSELPFDWQASKVEQVERAWLPHVVDSGNFYHLISEIMPTFYANWCKLVGMCSYNERHGFELLFIHPDPKRRFGLAPPLQQAWQCFSKQPFRKLIDMNGQPMLVRHGVVGIGPYMRAYERQEFRSSWADPPAGTMTRWRHFLSDCTGTGFVDAEAPRDVLRMTFVNRPWGAGRSFINLHEILVWLNRDWLPQQQLARPVEVETATVHEWQDLDEQIEVFKRTNLLVYPHGATMAHAIFLPRGAVALEVIPWPNVTEPHGWLQSIKRQFELERLQLLLMVNEFRDHLVLNWHALAQDPDWRSLTAEEKVALQEKGTCPKQFEPKCFFDWLHWRSELVLNKEQLAEKLTEAFKLLTKDSNTKLADAQSAQSQL